MERNPWFRALIILAVIALLIHLAGQVWGIAQHFGDIIIVFFLAWLLAFILSPIAQALERGYGVSRSLAAGLVYLGMLLVVVVAAVLVVPLAVEQLVQLGQRLPAYVAVVQSWVGFAQAELVDRGIPVDLTNVYKGPDLTTQVANIGSGVVANTITVVGGIASVLFNATIVLVVSFYLVTDGERLGRRIAEFVPNGYRLETQFFLDSINRTFGGWLRGTLIMCLVYGIGNAVVMAVAGLSYVLLASLLAGVLIIIPIVGSLLAMVAPILIAALQGDVTKLVLVVVGLLILQTLVFNVVSPKVMGESIGMHPLLVFLALLVGIKQAGLAGAIFGVPVIGVIWAMLVYLLEKRGTSRQGTDSLLALAGEGEVADSEGGTVGVATRPGRRRRQAVSGLRDGLARLRRALSGGRDYGRRVRPGD